MCLHELVKRDKPPNSGVGWKVFKRDRKSGNTTFIVQPMNTCIRVNDGTSPKSICKEDGWYRPFFSNGKVKMLIEGEYDAGFHLFTHKSDAKKSWDFYVKYGNLSDDREYVILKVRWKILCAEGIELYENDKTKVIVCKYIKLI